ncbi:MFS transporter [Streptomyces sp. P1-3]|uniref:MFS transporter n=1 Tax=Streptomyces sp. P1-3 TaxID=3421658 RepID=UPI003D35A387
MVGQAVLSAPGGGAETGAAEPGPAAEERRGRRNTVVLLAFTAITNLADGVTKIALPLLAARETGSPTLVAAVSLTLSLPWLLVALHVGVLVDRCDRRRLLWVADATRLLAVGALFWAVAGDRLSIPFLCAAGAVLGVAEVVALTAAGAAIPSLVPPAGRERANAWIAGAETVCNEFCGPFVGGLLLAAGAGFALGVTWASYLASSLLLLLLVGRFRAVCQQPEQGRAPEQGWAEGGGGNGDGRSLHRDIAAGLRFVWRQRLLRTMSLILTVLCACWGGWLALMPLYATTTMGLTAREYGTVLSALGLGGLVGAVVVTRLNRRLGRRRVMFADLIGTLAMMAVPALTTDVWAVAAATFAGGMGGTLWSVNARTLSQQLVPDHMLGRTNAVSRLFSWGAMPVGAGAIGVLAEWLGPRPAFLAFAVAVAATVPFFLRVPIPGAAATGQPISKTLRSPSA